MEAAIYSESAARDAGLSLFKPYRQRKWVSNPRPSIVSHSVDAWSAPEEVVASPNASTSGLLNSERISLAAAIGYRLFELMKFSIEDSEPLPSPDSIADLWRFIDENPSAPNPLLTSDSEGVLVATWRTSAVSMLSIRFVGKSQIEFACTRQDKHEKVSREWGENHLESFVSSFRYADEFLGGGN
jgi:hypothetical protein